eukprot:1152545-Pelagomonas_calceolata.AAC.1
MLQDGVAVFAPRRFRKTFRIHLCRGLFIGVPCQPDERIWNLDNVEPRGHCRRAPSGDLDIDMLLC